MQVSVQGGFTSYFRGRVSRVRSALCADASGPAHRHAAAGAARVRPPRPGIQGIAQDRETRCRQVHAQLVGSTGQGSSSRKLASDGMPSEGCGAMRARVHAARPCVGSIDPPGTVGPVHCNGQGDGLPVCPCRRNSALHHGVVAFVHRALFKGAAQHALVVRAACHDDQAGGGLVQAVHHQRVGKTACARALRQSCLSGPRPVRTASPRVCCNTTSVSSAKRPPAPAARAQAASPPSIRRCTVSQNSPTSLGL